MAPGKEANAQCVCNSNFDIHVYTPWSWHLLQEKLWRKGQKKVLKCHYSATVFVVPDQTLQVDSDLMEKYCNSKKALHAMFGQHCLRETKPFQDPGNCGHQGASLPLN